MKKRLLIMVLAGMLSLQACDTAKPEEPTLLNYTSPEISGLSPIHPYPNPDDVCQVVGDSDVTSSLRTEGRALIACPKHEKGAIEDRRREGARVVGNAEHWVLLSVRNSEIK